MRRDKQLITPVPATERQTFFLNCWFNMVHRASVDSYRVRVMNPENILREFLKMYEPQADENDRRAVAEEALEIFAGDPILKDEKYLVLSEFIMLLHKAIKPSTDAAPQNSGKNTNRSTQASAKKVLGFMKYSVLIQSFANELITTLHKYYLNDCFAWLEVTLADLSPVTDNSELNKLYGQIERVCRNLLSVALDDGNSLESLFQHYRGLVKTQDVIKLLGQEDSEVPPLPEVSYNFIDRFNKLRTQLTAPEKSNNLIFMLNGVANPDHFPEKIGNLNFSSDPPSNFTPKNKREQSLTRPLKNRRYVYVTINGRDGRGAGMLAYRRIGEILDLVRFEYDKSSVWLSPTFILDEGERQHLLRIPQVVPNPENELPPQKLEEFVEHLNGLVCREAMHTEAKDRIFSAFRLYRVGADADIFENKLVNWWTALEYLAKGSKGGGGSIGGSVEAALAPTLCLAYLPKHLATYRSMFKGTGKTISKINGEVLEIEKLTNAELYLLFKDPAYTPALKTASCSEAYLWHYLQQFIDSLSTPAKTLNLLASHERRLRWQIQRIYRARCDIVHSGQQVVNASLLCANLEYYLKVTLDSMLLSFQEITSLRGPHEFFERTRHRFERLSQDLSKHNSDTLLVASLTTQESYANN